MKVLMYGSLITAFAFIGLYIFARYNSNRISWCSPKLKKAFLFCGALAYLIFFGLAFLIHEQNETSFVTISSAAKDKIKQVLNTSVSDPSNAEDARISVKARTVPNTIIPNEKLVIQFLVANESETDLNDLRMNFLVGNLSNNFVIKAIKGNKEVHLLDNIVTLGNLKAGESTKLQFDLLPKNIVDYSAEISWQAGNNYILGEDKEPLKTLLRVKVDEDIKIVEDPDFSDFAQLESVEYQE